MADDFSVIDAYQNDTDPFSVIDDYEPQKPSLAGDIGRLALQGVSNVGGTVGYGLEKTGIAPEFGRKLQESDVANTQRLQANLSPEQQSANVQPFINPNYKPDTPKGSSFINPEFGLRSVIGNVVPSIPGTLAMGVFGSPLASAATKGLSLAGVGAKTAQTVGTGLGFGASEGAFSGAQNAAQWGAEQRAKPIEAFATSPAFQQALAEFGDPEKAKEAIINKGQSDIFNETLIKTGGISALTGGGAFGVLKGAQATDKVLPSFVKGVASEAGQEAPQSFYEEVATNKATQKYVDPTQDPYENALNAGIVGGIAGGVMGSVGGVGPLSRAAMNAARTRNERSDQNIDNTGQPVPPNDTQPATGSVVGEVGPDNTGNNQATTTEQINAQRSRSTETDNRGTIPGDQPLAGTDGPSGAGQPNLDLLNSNNTGIGQGQPGQINPVDQLRNLDGRNLSEEAGNGFIDGQLQERAIQSEPSPTRRDDQVKALINEELARDPKAKPQDIIDKVSSQVDFESKKQSALDRWNEAFNSVQDEKAKKVLANDIKLIDTATPENLDKKVEKASERATKYGVIIPDEITNNMGNPTGSISSESETFNSTNISSNENKSRDNRNGQESYQGSRERIPSVSERIELFDKQGNLADNLTLTESREDDSDTERYQDSKTGNGKPDDLLAREAKGNGTQFSQSDTGIVQSDKDNVGQYVERNIQTARTTTTQRIEGLTDEKAQEESPKNAANADEEGRESLLDQARQGVFIPSHRDPLDGEEFMHLGGNDYVTRKQVEEGKIDSEQYNFEPGELEPNDQKETQAQDQTIERRAEVPVSSVAGRYELSQDRGTSGLPGRLSEGEQSTGQRPDLPSAGGELSQLTNQEELAKVDANKKLEIDNEAHKASTSPLNNLNEPTEAQKEAGNYKKGHINFQGLNIAIENPQGSKRSGIDQEGKKWEVEMANHYGYIKRTEGADKDQVDTFIGPNPEAQKAFVVNQIDPKTGKFDEHKIMLGFNTKEEAELGYRSNYAKNWKGLDSIIEMPLSELKDRINKNEFKKPIKDNEFKKTNNQTTPTQPAPQEQDTLTTGTVALSESAQAEPVREAYKLKTGRDTFTPKEADLLIKNRGLTDYSVSEPDKEGKVQITKPVAQIPEKTGITESVQQDTVAKSLSLNEQQVKIRNKSIPVSQVSQSILDEYGIKANVTPDKDGTVKITLPSKHATQSLTTLTKELRKSGNDILTGATENELFIYAKPREIKQGQLIQSGEEVTHQFSDYDKVAKEYGYQVKSDGSIAKEDGKELPVKVSVVKNRLRIEAKDSGNLLYSGIAEPKSIGKFVEKFWYAQKKPQTSPIAAQETPIEQASQTTPTQTTEATAAQTGSLSDFTEKKLNASNYRTAYEESPELLLNFQKRAKEEWKEQIESATTRLPDHVIDEYVNNYGMESLQSRLRGIHEKAIEGWMPKDIRETVIPKAKPLPVYQRPIYERTWPQQLSEEKKSISRKLSRQEINDTRKQWLDAIGKAEYEGKTIPDNVLKSRDFITGKSSSLNKQKNKTPAMPMSQDADASFQGRQLPTRVSKENPLAINSGSNNIIHHESILTQPKKQYLIDQKRAWLSEHKNALPQVKEKAFKDLEANYETDVERARASLPFEQYKTLPDNAKFSDDVNRQVYDQLQKDYGKSELGGPISEGQSNTQATENKGSGVVSESELNKNVKYSKSAQSTENFAKQVKDEIGLKSFIVFDRGNDIELASLIVNKDDQKKGKGSEAMNRLINYADSTGKRLILTPGLPDDNHGTTSRSRLVKFYKRFGFKENKGRGIDFAMGAGKMYRDPQKKFSKADKPQLYSQLRKAFDSTSDRIFTTGPQVKAWLKGNAPKLGVKSDEIYWSGIEDYLDIQGKVSKQEVLAYLDENGVKTEDKILTEGSTNFEFQNYDTTQIEIWNDEIEDYESFTADLYSYTTDGSTWDDAGSIIHYDDENGDYIKHIAETNSGEKEEFENENEAERWLAETISYENRNDDTGKVKHNNPQLTLPGGKNYRETVVTIPSVEEFNRQDSTHFGDVASGKQIAWTRSNVRTDENGKDTLFLEEIQSQRNQAARQDGVKPQGKTPPAPFITDSNGKATNAYISLLLKKSILQAIENGQDSVSWTTGEQQAERYDLSRTIKEIRINKVFDGRYKLDAIDKNDRKVESNYYSSEELPNVIGKELSEKAIKLADKKASEEITELPDDYDIVKDGDKFLITPPGQIHAMPFNGKHDTIEQAVIAAIERINSERDKTAIISGIDLKIGGEWADSMYGNEQGLDRNGKPSLILQAVRDIAKRFGGKVGSVELNTGTQPALMITPEMRAKVTGEGLPLFSKEKAKASSTVAELKGLLNAQDKKLAQSGKLKIVQSKTNIPKGLISIDANGVEGFYDPKSKSVYLIADNVTKDNLRSVLDHEYLHAALAENPKLKERLMGAHSELRDIFSKVESGEYSGDYKTLYNEALRRTDRANTPDADRFEEFLSYAISSWQKSPSSLPKQLAKAIKDLVAAIKAAIFRYTGYIGQITPADLAALARSSLNYSENSSSSEQAETDTKYSMADDLREFKERAGLGPKRTLTQAISDILNRGISGNTQLIKDKWEEVKPQIEQGVFDKFLGIKLAEKEILGDVAHSISGYIGARLSTGSSSTMSAIIQYGAPEWKNGIIQKKAGSKGFADIIKPVADDMENFTAWMVARRSDRLFMEGKENNFTREMIDAGLSLFKPKYQTVADDIAALNSSILDLAQDAGLIDPSARNLFENTDYIPFYRIVEGKAKGPRNRQGLSHQTSGIRMLKGGENPMSDPLGNLMQNWAHLVDASMKNSALNKTLKNLEGSRFITSVPRVEFKSALIPKEQIKKLMLNSGLPQQIVDAMPPEITKGIAKMWAMQAPTDPDIVRVMRGGKSDYFRVNDGMLLTSLVAVNQTPLTGAFKYMRAFKSLLTGAVTADPTFMARNFIRDSMQSWTIAEEKGFKFGVDSIKGAIKTFKEDNDFIDMMFAGASFQGGYGNYNNPDAARKSMDAALRKKGIKDVNGFMESVLDTPKKYWEAYRSIGDAIENANRDAILENAKKAGKEKAEYLFEAKDLMDFSMHGSFVLFRALNDMLPFFNARLEGLYRLVRAGKTQEAKKLILMKGASIAMMSLALLAINSDNDDYEALEDWDADAYWHFFFGDQHFRIPKPFELGLMFGTIPERSARLLIGKDTMKEFASRMGHAASDTLAFNPIPQMFRPFMEVYANTDMFTGRPIENMSDEGKLPSARYNQNTSETMRLLSSLLPEALGASPKRLEHLMHGYTGAMGMYLLGTSDILVNAASGGPSEPSMRMDRIPVLKAFYQQTPAMHTKYGTQFYDMLREVEQVNRTINAYKKEGRLEEARELQQENAGKLKVRKQLTKANKSLSEVRKTIDAIHRSSLSPDQKRVKIDRLMERSNDKIQALVKRTHPYFN